MGRIPGCSATTLSLAVVYFIWGAIYLAIRFGLDTFPPFILNGLRYSLAGGAMFLVLLALGTPSPTRRQWWNLVRVAALMMVGGAGLVTVAQDVGVGSGLTATAVAMIPVWAALVAGVLGTWPRHVEWVGLAVGLLGVGLLSQEGDFQSSTLGTALVIIGPALWALGSVWQTRLDTPQPAMATAGTLLSGGTALLVLGVLAGERITVAPTVESLAALLFLIVFGSIVGYTAYVYLLRHTSAVMATSYAYVNPAIAVVLGMTIGGETITGPLVVALPLILAGVAIVTLAQRGSRVVAPEAISSEPAELTEADGRR